MTTNRLAAGMARMRARMKAFAGTAVTYRRGDDSVELTATVGKTIARVDRGYGATIRMELRDYLVEAEDLVLGGAAVEPAAGDRIEETDADGTIWSYEVSKPDSTEREWRWHGRDRRTYRIHTKLLEKT